MSVSSDASLDIRAWRGTAGFSGYGWAAASVAASTALIWLSRGLLDKGQASLLYLPVVIVCSIRFGFGPAVAGAVFSFLCWDYFFLPPYDTFIISNPKDWLSLVVFLITAITTARLASQAERRAFEARAREMEIRTLNRASEAVSREVIDERVFAALAAQVIDTCKASSCVIFRRTPSGDLEEEVVQTALIDGAEYVPEIIRGVAKAALEYDQVVGFGDSTDLWHKALLLVGARRSETATVGAYLPLHAQDHMVGVLYAGPRRDGHPYSGAEERLIRTLANHAAVVIARKALAARAAQVEALREADSLKDALLSLVSHELRTPLAAIKATASGLLQAGSSWDERGRDEALAAIDREADRLSRVVTNLLDLSRLEAGAWRPAKDWCDIGEIIGTVLDRLPVKDGDRVHVSISERTPLVCADYTQIALVVTNLIENAVKYAPPDTPIDVTVGPEYNGHEDQPSGAVVAVRDYGSGLEPGEEERLFIRFYRGVRHERSEVHGTGLGLSLCRVIVTAHDGAISAANAAPPEPPGAVFTFSLPVG